VAKSPLPLRVVIDTNVVVSALVFKSGALSRLREMWQAGRILPLVSRETTQELLAVLKYPKFALSEHEQHEILAAYLPYCETHPEPKPRIKFPQCRDPDDNAYLELAAAGSAAFLVTGDADLHAITTKLPFRIAPPRELLQYVENA
jgi:putative PIN family toxin of toxin-antitoxin system